MVAQGWRRFVWAVVLVAGLVAFSASLYSASASIGKPITRTRTVEIPQPALTSASTVDDVRGRFEGKPQTATGANVAGQLAANCPHVDIYQQADGAVLVCHA